MCEVDMHCKSVAMLSKQGLPLILHYLWRTCTPRVLSATITGYVELLQNVFASGDVWFTNLCLLWNLLTN